MRLRSKRVLKRAKHKITSNVKKQGFANQRRLSLRSSKSETVSCDDSCENLEMGMKETLKACDKGVFLGSEVLDPNKDSGPEEEVEEEEGNESMSVHVSDTGIDFSGFEVFADNPVIVNGDHGNANRLVKFNAMKEKVKGGTKKKNVGKKKVEKADVVFGINGDDKETSLEDHENANLLVKCNETKGNVKGAKKLEKIDVVGRDGDDGKEPSLDDHEKANLLGTCSEMKDKVEEGKKKKNAGRKKIEKINVVLGKNGDDGKETLLDDRENANLLGTCNEMKEKEKGVKKKSNVGKKKIETTDVVFGVNGDEDERACAPLKHKMERKRKNEKASGSGSECNVKAKKMKVEKDGVRVIKKKKSRSRNRATFIGWGENRPRSVVLSLRASDDTPMKSPESHETPKKVVTEAKNSRPKKKSKKRERPCKPEGETTPLPLNEVLPRKKLKRRGRPPRLPHEKVNGNGNVTMKVKRRGRPRKNPENIEPMEVEGDSVNTGTGILGRNLRRSQLKQLIREKISSLLLKCGWKITSIQRPWKISKDPVYTEPNGKRSHWTITDAYAKLKLRVETGVADDTEKSGFTPIPEEEISTLFRHSLKARKKHAMRNLKKVKKVKTVFEKKKKESKKSKDGSKRKMLFKPRVVVDGSETEPKKDSKGDLVIKKRNLLSWMVDSGVILSGTKVLYGKTRRQKRSLEGVITSDGIRCGCCKEVMGVTEFVGHCGGKPVRVFDNLYLESGTCVRTCLMDSWRKEEELNSVKFNFVDVQGDDPNDDTCTICGDGGDLTCCDGCPSTFHQSCLDIQIPSGHWDCMYCTCKFCGAVSVSTPEVEDPCDPVTSQMLSCCLCDEKFHQSCLQEDEDVNKDSNRQPFCGRKCRELFERLQAHIGVKHELEDGFSWSLLQRSEIDQDFNVQDTRLKVEQNSKLAVAYSVMDECFVPILDDRSGASILRNVIYNCGSNLKRLNYAGFVTAVLEKGDEFISAASIRIHGNRLAEMPFIGTRHMYRRQGMCRRLLDAIESTLYSLGVEELIIPAIPALLQTWTNAFGFMPLDEAKKQAMKCMSLMVFPGIDMLKKPLSAGVGRDVTVNEQKEETVLQADGCSGSNPNDESTPQLETTSSNATDYKQRTADAGKSVFDYNEPENETLLTDCCGCRDYGNDKSTVNSLCDLNLPCDTDRQTSVDSESSELKLDAENGGVHGVKANVKPSLLTSESVLKNTFDLNLRPTAIETDVHTINDEPRARINPLEVSDARTHIDPSADSIL